MTRARRDQPRSRGRLTADPRADRNAAAGSCANASARSALVSASYRRNWWAKLGKGHYWHFILSQIVKYNCPLALGAE